MTTRPWHIAGLAAGILLLAACTTGTPADTTDSGTSTTTASEPEPTTTEPTTEPSSSSSAPVGLEQPAVWPAAATVFDTPEEAAADFVEQAVGVMPSLGDFMAGDTRSGEIQLFFDGEDGNTPIERSLLLMRQLGAESGWFVLAAVSDYQQISAPEQGAVVPAGALEVSGVGRGFEGLVIVEALRPGDPEPLDTQLGAGGSMEPTEPWTVTLDLSGATPGETIAIVARGGTGHDADPGELGAVAVVIAD